jgi:hypothetical protein
MMTQGAEVAPVVSVTECGGAYLEARAAMNVEPRDAACHGG